MFEGKMVGKNVYRVECYDKDGNLKWAEEVPNLITDAGCDDILDKYFKGAAYTASFFVGLKTAGAIAATDTLAAPGAWTEVVSYTGNRKALTLGAVSGKSVDNSASKASFSMTSSVTVAGAFIATVATGTAGILYGVIDFASPRAVIASDVINVTCTLTQASA